jgi:hypothetical protein
MADGLRGIHIVVELAYLDAENFGLSLGQALRRNPANFTAA